MKIFRQIWQILTGVDFFRQIVTPPPPRPGDIQPVVTGGNFYRIINHPYLENGSFKEKIKANSRPFARIILSGNIIGLAPLFIYQTVSVKKASDKKIIYRFDRLSHNLRRVDFTKKLRQIAGLEILQGSF